MKTSSIFIMPVTTGSPRNKDALSEARASEATRRSSGGLLGRGAVIIFGKHVLLLEDVGFAIN